MERNYYSSSTPWAPTTWREDKQNGEDRESSLVHQWRNLSNDGKCEPNNRLTERKNKNMVSEFKERRQREPPPHLFPEDAGQTKGPTTVATQNKQANEHDQKQDQVGNYRRDKTKYAGLSADRVTGMLCRGPNSAKLRMRWAKWVRVIKRSHLPRQHLFTAWTKFRVFYKRRGLLLMWNPEPIIHMVIDIIIPALFLFQIAMLRYQWAPEFWLLLRGIVIKTYMRRTTNSEAAAADM